jgi:hypothetical protein
VTHLLRLPGGVLPCLLHLFSLFKIVHLFWC